MCTVYRVVSLSRVTTHIVGRPLRKLGPKVRQWLDSEGQFKTGLVAELGHHVLVFYHLATALREDLRSARVLLILGAQEVLARAM